MTVHNAWQLNSGVRQALSVDDLVSKSQFISVHVPLLDATRGLINADRLKLMKKQGVILNFARDAIVDEKAVRSEEHTSELQSLMRISYAVFCLKKKIQTKHNSKLREIQ